MRPPIDLYAAALLHWRLMALIGAFFAGVLTRACVRVAGSLVDLKELDPNLLKMSMSVAGLIVAVWLLITARQVAKRLGLRGWLNFYVVAKESAAFFEDQGIRSNFFGPHLSAIPRPAKPASQDDKGDAA